MAFEDTPQNAEAFDAYCYGFRQFNGVTFRYVLRDGVDIDSEVEQNIENDKVLRSVVTGALEDQSHFGLGYIRDTTFQVAEEQLAFVVT